MHIGWPKCGSSTLQSMLGLNQGRLAKKGFYYPIIDGKKNFGNAKPLLRGRSQDKSGDKRQKLRRIFLRHPKLAKITDHQKYFRETYLQSGHDNIILSAEGLYRAARVNDLSYVFEHFDTIKIYWVIRPKMLKVQSGYLHGVRSGKYKQEFGDLIDTEFYRNKADDNHNYLQVINFWSGIAGADNINILMLDNRFPSIEKQFFEAMLGSFPNDLRPGKLRNVKIGAVPTAAIMNLPDESDQFEEYLQKIKFIRERARQLELTTATVNVLTPEIHARLSERFRADDEAFVQCQNKYTLDDIRPDVSDIVASSTTLASVREWDDYIRLKRSLAEDGIII